MPQFAGSDIAFWLGKAAHAIQRDHQNRLRFDRYPFVGERVRSLPLARTSSWGTLSNVAACGSKSAHVKGDRLSNFHTAPLFRPCLAGCDFVELWTCHAKCCIVGTGVDATRGAVDAAA